MTRLPVRQRHSLLARLGAAAPAVSLHEDIAANLTGVLSGRKGYGTFLPELGLGEYFGKLGTRESVDVLKGELEANISQLEPRIGNPVLEMTGHDPDFWLHFNLSGTVADAPARFVISFQTTLGDVRVRVA